MFLLPLLVLSLHPTLVLSQTDYLPFVKEGKSWVYDHVNGRQQRVTLAMLGDTADGSLYMYDAADGAEKKLMEQGMNAGKEAVLHYGGCTAETLTVRSGTDISSSDHTYRVVGLAAGMDGEVSHRWIEGIGDETLGLRLTGSTDYALVACYDGGERIYGAEGTPEGQVNEAVITSVGGKSVEGSCYDLQGRRLQGRPTKGQRRGLSIVRSADGSVRKVMR